MRLTAQQQRQIRQCVAAHLGADARASLFGSRLNDQRRGGDVDLVIETAKHIPLLDRAALKLALETSLQLPVDLIFHEAGTTGTAFQALAHAQAQPITRSGQ